MRRKTVLWFGNDFIRLDDWRDIPGIGLVNFGHVQMLPWTKCAPRDEPPDGSNCYLELNP